MEEAKQKELHHLEKLTINKLREESLEKYPEIKSVHGMGKEELIQAICRIKGIPYHEKEAKAKKTQQKKVRLKKDIKKLRAKKEGLQGNEFKKQRGILRKKIKTLKRNLRKVA